jgi:hypothetical protein
LAISWWSPAVIGTLIFVACDVGAIPAGGVPPGDDDGQTGDPVGQPDSGITTEVACDEPAATGESGEHNPGQPCLVCHAAGGEGPTFRLAGTIYTGLAGGAPVVGATIRVIDADGSEHTTVSARNGNFWFEEAIAFPARTSASSCPDTRPMITLLDGASGSCNANGCHDADFRIHLP